MMRSSQALGCSLVLNTRVPKAFQAFCGDILNLKGEKEKGRENY
jgi:hypothetical protein